MDVERIWEVAAEDISVLKEFCENQLGELLQTKGPNIDEESLKFIEETLKIAEWCEEAQEKAAERIAEFDEQK